MSATVLFVGAGDLAARCAAALSADPAGPLEKLAFRCRECRERDCEVEARELDRDRRPNIVVWRPTRLR